MSLLPSQQVAKVLELQLQHQSFQWIFRVDFLYDWLVWSPCCPRNCQDRTPQFETINSFCSAFFMIQLSFSVVIYGCESWTIKKAERWRTELWCWRRFLRITWTARRSNQSVIKEINPEFSIGRTDAEAETPTLRPPDAKNWLAGKKPRCWERSKAGGEGDDRGWDGWMASPTQWTWI